jgi:hypothetical protein
MIPLVSLRLVVLDNTSFELVANLRNWKSIVARDPIAQRLAPGNFCHGWPAVTSIETPCIPKYSNFLGLQAQFSLAIITE